MPLQSLVEDLSHIIELQQAVAASHLSLFELMVFICEKTQALGHASGAVVELNEGEEMVYKACSGTLKDSLGLRLNLHASISGLSVKTGEVLYCKDSETDQRVDRESCRKVGARSLICVPLLSEKKTIGVLKLVSPEIEKFQEREVNLLRLCAGLLSTTIAQAESALQQEAAHKQLEDSEYKFRSLISTAYDGIMISKNGFAVEVNQAFCKIFGYTEKELVNIPIHHLVAPEERPKVLKFIQDGYDKPYHTIGLRKDETTFYAEVIGKNIVVNQEIIRMTTVRDITQMKLADDALRDSVEKSNQATRAKSEFLANMSHEIRTPLNGIMGMASLLEETKMTEEQEKYVNILKSSADTLLTLVNDILDFSKIEARKLSMEIIEFNLKQAIEDVYQILMPAAQHKKLNFTYELSPLITESIMGDPTRLRQILMNLMNNAIKFTAEGSVSLKVSLDNNKIQFEIIDTGIGIPEKSLQEMFKPFSQLDSSTTRKYGGTGLGLSICKQLVEMMNGSIKVESKEKIGSNFKVILPYIPGKIKKIYETIPSSSSPFSKMRVLIIEENPAYGLIMRNMVEKLGHIATVVGSGNEALEALDLMAYDILFLDLQMTEIRGTELTLKIRDSKKSWSQIPIVTMDTSNAQLIKPVQQVNLSQIISQYSEGKAQTPEEKLMTKNLKILLVDDAEENRVLILAYLKKFPFQFSIAENGELALDKMKQEIFDVVFMDIQMPVMDGLVATKMYRVWEKGNRSEKMKIIALSAHALEEEIEKSLAAGCDLHLTKPIKKSTLLETLAKI